VKTVDELVGRSGFLKLKDKPAASRAALLDMTRILPEHENAVHFEPDQVYDFHLEKTVDEKELLPAFERYTKKNKDEIPGETVNLLGKTLTVQSTDRSFGTILGSEIQKKYRGNLSDDSFKVECHGGGGQSFGAFIPKGLTLRLTGDANDYFGKGLSGGKLSVHPDSKFKGDAGENIIIGNVALFGATGGEAYINGIAGERFCVRNSGAVAVVEGCGDHGLEYMTGGTVVILGPTGRNLAAGMSGGTAYVFDEKHDLYKKVNKQMISMEEISTEHDRQILHHLLEKHLAETGSKTAKKILDDFDGAVQYFKKIIPNDFKKMVQEIARAEKNGLTRNEAVMEAFKVVTKAAG